MNRCHPCKSVPPSRLIFPRPRPPLRRHHGRSLRWRPARDRRVDSAAPPPPPPGNRSSPVGIPPRASAAGRRPPEPRHVVILKCEALRCGIVLAADLSVSAARETTLRHGNPVDVLCGVQFGVLDEINEFCFRSIARVLEFDMPPRYLVHERRSDPVVRITNSHEAHRLGGGPVPQPLIGQKFTAVSETPRLGPKAFDIFRPSISYTVVVPDLAFGHHGSEWLMNSMD